jgi:hypothetical protein
MSGTPSVNVVNPRGGYGNGTVELYGKLKWKNLTHNFGPPIGMQQLPDGSQGIGGTVIHYTPKEKLMCEVVAGGVATGSLAGTAGSIVGPIASAVGAAFGAVLAVVKGVVGITVAAIKGVFGIFTPGNTKESAKAADGAKKSAADAKSAATKAQSEASQMAREQEAATKRAQAVALANGGRASLRGPGSRNQKLEVAGGRVGASYNTHARMVASGAHSWTINLRH